MTIKEFPYHVIRDVIWADRIPAMVAHWREKGITELGIEVQQAGLQKVLYLLQELGFVPDRVIKTDKDPESGDRLERHILIIRDSIRLRRS